VTGNSAWAFAPAPVAPGVNNEEEEQDEAKTQENDRSRLAFKQFAESSGELTKIHALVNLHQSDHKKKGRPAAPLALALPVQGPLLHSIQVADKQDHQE
jgi:hypothetical protein